MKVKLTDLEFEIPNVVHIDDVEKMAAEKAVKKLECALDMLNTRLKGFKEGSHNRRFVKGYEEAVLDVQIIRGSALSTL